MQMDKMDKVGIFVLSNNTKSFSYILWIKYLNSVFNEGYQQDREGGRFGFCFAVWTVDKLLGFSRYISLEREVVALHTSYLRAGKCRNYNILLENPLLLFLSLQFLHPFLDGWQQCCVHSCKIQGRWRWRVVVKCYNRRPSCAWKASHRKQKYSGICNFRRNNTFSFRNTVFTRQLWKILFMDLGVNEVQNICLKYCPLVSGFTGRSVFPSDDCFDRVMPLHSHSPLACQASFWHTAQPAAAPEVQSTAGCLF